MRREAEGGRWSGNGMRREAEGGRLSGNGIGGEFPASWGVASGGESWGVASGREAWGVASKTQTSCPLALKKSGGETWALWFVLFLKQKKITAIFCSHCNHIKRSKMAPKSHCSHPKWHENSTKTTSAKTAKNASIDRSLFLLTFRVLCSEIDTTLQMQADNARDFMTIMTDGGFIHAPVP